MTITDNAGEIPEQILHKVFAPHLYDQAARERDWVVHGERNN